MTAHTERALVRARNDSSHREGTGEGMQCQCPPPLAGPTCLRLVIASPHIGGPGRVGHASDEDAVKPLSSKSAFLRQTAENSRVGAGMAADWGPRLARRNSSTVLQERLVFKPV